MATFEPNAVCCRVKWIGNDYGTALWQLMVLQTPMPFDGAQRIGGQTQAAPVLFLCEAARERVRQQGRITDPVAQRRNVDHDLGQAIKQVFAELAFADELAQILVRSADDAHIDGNFLPSTQALDHPLLQKAQQFDLQRQRNVADFVEEERPAMRQLDLAFGHFDCTSERALFMPEQLTLDQAFRDRRAVDGD